MSATEAHRAAVAELEGLSRAVTVSPSEITPQRVERMGALLDAVGQGLALGAAPGAAGPSPEMVGLRERHREDLLRIRDALLRFNEFLRVRRAQIRAAAAQASAAQSWSARLRETF